MINREREVLIGPAHKKRKQNSYQQDNTFTSNNSLSKMLLIGTLTILIYVLPWIFTTFTEEYYEITKNFFLIVCVSILIMVWGVTTIIKKRVILFKTPIDWAMLAIVLVSLFSTLFSINIDTSIWGFQMRLTGGLVSTLTLAITYYLVVNTINSKTTVNFLLKSILYSFSLLGLFTIIKSFGLLDSLFIQLINLDPAWSYLRHPLFTTTGNPNSLAFLFLTALPLSIFLLINNKSSTRRQMLIGFLISVILIIAISITTIASLQDPFRVSIWLIIFFVLGISIFFTQKQLKTRRIYLSLNLSLLLLAIIGAFFALNNDTQLKFKEFLNNTLKTEFNFSRYYDIPTNTSLAVVSGTYNKFGTKGVLIGTGLDTYGYNFPQFRPFEQNFQLNWYENYTRSNTQIESLLINNGLIGGGIIIILLAYFILNFIFSKIIKSGKLSKDQNLVGFSLVLLIFLTSFFLIYHTVTLLFFYWLIFGLGFKLYMMENPDEAVRVEAQFKFINRLNPEKSISLAPYIFTAITVIGSVILIFSITVNFFSEKYYSESLKLVSEKNYDAAYDKLVASVNINSSRDYYHQKISSVALSKLEVISQTGTDNTISDIQKQKDLSAQNYLLKLINVEIEQSIKLNPENHENFQNAAVIYKRLTELTQGKQYGNEALRAIEKSIAKNPNNPDNYLLLGYIWQFNADKNLKSEAEKAYLEAYRLQPSYALTIIQLGGYLEYVEKYTEALKLYQISLDDIYFEESKFNQYLKEKIVELKGKTD